MGKSMYKEKVVKQLYNTVDSRCLNLAYLEVKIWFLPKHENLTTCKNIVESNFSSLPQ